MCERPPMRESAEPTAVIVPDRGGTHPLIPVIAVILGNLIPVIGVLFYDWSLFDLFYLYWAENVLIGAFTALRMLLCAASWGWVMLIGSMFNIAFFCVHYGMFCFGHGMILFELFNKDALPEGGDTLSSLLLYPLSAGEAGFYWALAGLALVVVTEGIRDIIKDRRDARLPMTIMFTPYGRIIILHVTILFGGLAAQELGSPVWALLLLAALKTGYDILVVTNKSPIHFDKGAKRL